MKLALSLTIFLIVMGFTSFSVEGFDESGKGNVKLKEDDVCIPGNDESELNESVQKDKGPEVPTLLNPCGGLLERRKLKSSERHIMPQPKTFFALKSFMKRFKPSKTDYIFSSVNQTEELMKRMMISMEESRRHTRDSIKNNIKYFNKNKRGTFSKISSVDDFIRHQDELKLFGNIAELPITPSDMNCYPPPATEFLKVVCTESGGKTTCHVGRFTFVIHTGEQKLTPGSMQRLVNMMYKRTILGDKCFPVSVEDLPTPACECSAGLRLLEKPTTAPPRDFDIDTSLIPVTVECMKVEPNRCDPRRGPGETLYQCRWRTLGLRKRYALYGDDVVELEADESEGGLWRGFGDESCYLHRATTKLNTHQM